MRFAPFFDASVQYQSRLFDRLLDLLFLGVGVIVGEDGLGLANVFLGKCDGTFQTSRQTFGLGDVPYGIALVDINGDGLPDGIQSFGPYDGEVPQNKQRAFLNVPRSPTPWLVNPVYRCSAASDTRREMAAPSRSRPTRSGSKCRMVACDSERR